MEPSVLLELPRRHARQSNLHMSALRHDERCVAVLLLFERSVPTHNLHSFGQL